MNIECYLCKNKQLKERSGNVRDNPSLKVLECSSCGLVFLSSFEHIKDDFYEKSGIHNSQVPPIEAWDKEANADGIRHFESLKDKLVGSSLLDFGCGTGNFLLKARALTDKIAGVEPEERLVEYCRSNGIKVYSSISKIPSGEKYDFITLFHVLEHLVNPRDVLIRLKDFLSSKGEIIIEVPNADDALLSLYENKAFSEFTYWSCHLFLFNPGTLKSIASQAGLKVNYIKQVQRYPLSNHLYWLANGMPGGHKEWGFLNSEELNKAYAKQLAGINKCDSVLASLSI
ncbi:MAG: class I SAM-dependent methyltransferase [Candidatus Omnitrophica bacterium]|nr:class I SAM-dependent methyltransferase [Candidatus Omnitrophota bacterium]MDD5429919.1 class I SAM-dependent methyltransferase [Candidatus Omnitrophota bacterium]